MTELHFRKTHNNFLDFVLATKDELIIMSPYIKLEPLKMLLEKVDPAVKIIVVARWRISDLVFGSSDLEIFDYLKSRNHSLYTHHQIHLKIVVKDKKDILLGSANVTGSGLGLFENSNIEAIAIDSLDEKYLPSIYSILKESKLVTSDIVQKLSEEVEKNAILKENQKKMEADFLRIEKEILINSKTSLLVDDFLFAPSVEDLLVYIRNETHEREVDHDFRILGISDRTATLEQLKQSFLNSNAYSWQLENITGNVLFGRYSELLHNSLMDDPKPYRKTVKDLVSNMFSWTKNCSIDYEIVDHAHTSSMVKKVE